VNAAVIGAAEGALIAAPRGSLPLITASAIAVGAYQGLNSKLTCDQLGDLYFGVGTKADQR
jgi:hypothetical protein